MASTSVRGMAPEVPRDEMSAAAISAAMPGLADSTADLVGWAASAARTRGGRLPAGRGRRLLATALGLSEDRLAALSDGDVTVAVDRIRAIADQCRHLASQVTVDELTGALRRGAGMAALQRDIDRTRRTENGRLAVVFVDVDGLKAVNDRDGHAAGDELLRATVVAIRGRLRSYDLVVRYGGDEFVCVLTGADHAQADRTAAALRDHVRERTGNGVSTGVASLRVDDTVNSVIERADAALYAGRQDARASVPLARSRRAAVRR